MDTKTVYVPVPIAERLPEKKGWYFVCLPKRDEQSSGYWDGNVWYREVPTHWLEKQEIFVITKTEFEAKIADAFNTGYEEFKYNMYKDK